MLESKHFIHNPVNFFFFFKSSVKAQIILFNLVQGGRVMLNMQQASKHHCKYSLFSCQIFFWHNVLWLTLDETRVKRTGVLILFTTAPFIFLEIWFSSFLILQRLWVSKVFTAATQWRNILTLCPFSIISERTFEIKKWKKCYGTKTKFFWTRFCWF